MRRAQVHSLPRVLLRGQPGQPFGGGGGPGAVSRAAPDPARRRAQPGAFASPGPAQGLRAGAQCRHGLRNRFRRPGGQPPREGREPGGRHADGGFRRFALGVVPRSGGAGGTAARFPAPAHPHRAALRARQSGPHRGRRRSAVRRRRQPAGQHHYSGIASRRGPAQHPRRRGAVARRVPQGWQAGARRKPAGPQPLDLRRRDGQDRGAVAAADRRRATSSPMPMAGSCFSPARGSTPW